ncbi:MAG TPA: multicopper oxidase domain-containing protein [Burkholderiales bacterium]|nr:multicopper oxidase domain-containing protein [Burkholderiales bacterium]
MEIALAATKGEAPLLSGRATPVLSYRGKLVRGEAASVEPIPGSYLGPIIRVRKGQRVRLVLENGLDEATNIHWHGLHVPDDMDGHPRHTAAPGKRFVYEFEVRDRAGTYFFHPHPHGRTGRQVYFGLAGLFLVSDEEEQAAKLPSGEYDVPLILQDRSFDGENRLVFLPDERARHGTRGGGMMGGMMGGGMMDMMTRMMGFLGDRILVNGRPDATLSVATRPYRLRLLNASNARIFKLAWDDGSPLTVIGTDGGLLEAPVQRSYVTLAPGERLELWADFSRYGIGAELTMRSLEFAGDMAMGGAMMGGSMMGGRMMGMMMGNQALPNGAAFPVLKVRVARREKAPGTLPKRLSTVVRHRPEDAVNYRRPRLFNITMGMMEWGINGRGFEMEGVAEDEIVKLGTLEVWEFANDASMGMMGMMAHPMHIHGLQFQILERSVTRALREAWNSVSAGYVDEGWKDEVFLMPGERAKVLLAFRDFPGLFPYHCHMLEHADTGLMRNYLVRAN